jgi:predicted transcriptional regulator
MDAKDLASMAITVELKPEVEQRLRQHAQARGLSPEEYLASFVESQVLFLEPPPATLEEFEAALDAFAEDSDDMPVLPPEALTREAIYGDHH